MHYSRLKQATLKQRNLLFFRKSIFYTSKFKAFCSSQARFARDQCTFIMFTDEFRICINGTNRRKNVYRQRGENCIEESVPFGGGSCGGSGGFTTQPYISEA